VARNNTDQYFVLKKLRVRQKKKSSKKAKVIFQIRQDKKREEWKERHQRSERKLAKEVEFISARYGIAISRVFEACKRCPGLIQPTKKPLTVMNYLVTRTEHQLIIISKKIKRSTNIPWHPLPDYEDTLSFIQSGFFILRRLRCR
jgi:hypothetical protein